MDDLTSEERQEELQPIVIQLHHALLKAGKYSEANTLFTTIDTQRYVYVLPV